MTTARGLWRSGWPAWRIPLLLGALLALFFFPLLDPHAVLATRDMVEHHLPMRFAFAELARSGHPLWDPFAHGGQPLLSNPIYGALYPLSWLALILPVPAAVNLMVLIHAALAAWGAFRLARRLGARDGTAVLAALAFTCGPTFLSLLHSLNIALAMSFLPWAMAFALAVLDSPPGRPSKRSWFGLSLAMTAIFVLGDPLVVALSLLAIAAFALGGGGVRLRRLPRVAGAFAFAIALAAIQVLPALARLADSPRGAGLDWPQATAWSFPWQRLAELVFPSFFGDAARPELARYFGWGIHDRDYPFLLWIAIGLPLLLLAISSWMRRGSCERAAFLLMTAAGVFLAFGRHNPLYSWAWRYLPGIDKQRFPEKFLLLALTAAIFAGALGWQRLLDDREERAARPSGSAGGGRGARLPAALAAVSAALAGGLAALAFRAPQVITAFAGAHSGGPLAGAALQQALLFYRRESLLAFGFALAALALFALAGWSHTPRRWLELAALALVTLELWTYGHALVRTLPANVLFAPPQVARDLPPAPLRLFSDAPYRRDESAVVITAGEPTVHWTRAPLERLDSRAGNLMGYSYALDRDFDLSSTRSAARGLRFFEQARTDPELELRLLGAWGVSHLIARKPAGVLVEEARRLGPRLVSTVAPVSVRANDQALAPYRFVAGAELFPDAAAAERAAVAARLPLRASEYLIGDLAPAAEAGIRKLLTGRLDEAGMRAVEDHGDHVRIVYGAAHPALLVVASTFDRRWGAILGGAELPVFETAAGYMALLLPAGEGEVHLRFRDPWVNLGAAISATTLLVALGLALRARRLARLASEVGAASP